MTPNASRPFRPTTMADVVAHSGPLFRPPRRDLRRHRYLAWPSAGFQINPASGIRAAGALPPVATWSVLDSANAWREVAVFEPSGNMGGGRGYCRRMAKALQDRLNAEDRAR